VLHCTQERFTSAIVLIGVFFFLPFAPVLASAHRTAVKDVITVPTVAECRTDKSAACARFPDGAGNEREIELFSGSLKTVDVGLMGMHRIAGIPHQLAYVYGSVGGSGFTGNAWISVLDLTAGTKIASVASPAGYGVNNTYFAYIRGPRGEIYPFIAPGAHYLSSQPNPTGSFAAPAWNFLCVFDPGYIAKPDPACHTGFKHYDTAFTTADGVKDVVASGFRHGGGWVEDVDGDGWDDINLPFLQYILTISGKTGKHISLAHFDVANPSETGGTPYFHGGRFYGRFATFVDPATGSRNVLFAAGEGAGFFGGLYCGVSRYVAVAQWRPGPSLALKWSRYLSFAKTLFQPPYDSATKVIRLGDDLNNCPHFFGTALQWVDNRPLVVFNLFRKDNPLPACQAELLLEQRSRFDPAASAAYEKSCAPKEIPIARGSWSILVLDALTAAELAAYPNEYVWGEADNVLPNVPRSLLVQRLTTDGGHISYNRTGLSVDSLALLQLTGRPSLDPLADLIGPVPAPVTTGVLEYGEFGNMGGGPAHPPGIGSSYEGVAKLVVADIDGDGLNDVKLQDGKWIGYSASTGGLALKPPPRSPSVSDP
jgi:hypothetical protein